MRQYFLIVLVLFVMPLASAEYFKGCIISNEDGIFEDTDCDDYPNIVDNCPFVANEQIDRDQNGLGDACDVVIDQLFIEPEEPMQGRSMVVTLAVMNNRDYPLRNLLAKVEVPAAGVAVTEPMQPLAPGERRIVELLAKMPDCAPPQFTDIVGIVEYPYSPSKKEAFAQAVKVPVRVSGACPHDPGDASIVDILELQDIDPEQGGIYPFTINNHERESKAYILSVQGFESWGVAEILPGSVMVIPPGEAREGAVRVFSTMTGKHSFTFTVNARNDVQHVQLLADVPERLVQKPPQLQLFLGILVFLGVLVMIGVVFLFARHKNEQQLFQKVHPELVQKKRVKKTKKKKRPSRGS